MKRIKAYSRKYGNKYIKVSDEDYDRVKAYNWTVEKSGKRYYAMRKDGDKKMRLHRFIMQPKASHEVDHINHNGLDNRRENLRVVTAKQNRVNRPKTVSNTRKYKGIYFDTRVKKWVAQISYRRKRVYLGAFKRAKDAAQAYNNAAIKYYGEFACLNKIS